MDRRKLKDRGATTFSCTDAFGRRRVLEVKRVRPGVWFARISGTRGHARWGDKRQIREDISRFLETCALPRGERTW